VRRSDYLSSCLVDYVVRGSTGSNLVLLHAVADALIPEVVTATRALRCPYCGKAFGTRASLVRHLCRGNGCNLAFSADLRAVVVMYLRLRASLRRGSGYLYLREFPELRFRNAVELGEWVRRGGLALLSDKLLRV
jgi:hypothetical protein